MKEKFRESLHLRKDNIDSLTIEEITIRKFPNCNCVTYWIYISKRWGDYYGKSVTITKECFENLKNLGIEVEQGEYDEGVVCELHNS